MAIPFLLAVLSLCVAAYCVMHQRSRAALIASAVAMTLLVVQAVLLFTNPPPMPPSTMPSQPTTQE
jgi:hypothetical protein